MPARSTSEGDEALLAIGEVAERTGLSVSAIRFYDDKGLVRSERAPSGHRRFHRSSIRRLSFVLIAQQLGFSLTEIRAQLDGLPVDGAPTTDDWEQLSRRFLTHLDARIDALTVLRDRLDGCIGCGCLSLTHCALYNPDDRAARLGPGPRWVLGDDPGPDPGT